MPRPASNPFNSERLRPGVLDYIFSPDDCLDNVIERLRENHWRGQIIGPHGTGKSTLVRTLIPRLTALGFALQLGIFQGAAMQWSDAAPKHEDGQAGEGRREMVIIDGFEQLSSLARWRWKFVTRLRGQGLVVTAHHSVGLPELAKTSVSRQMALQIVEQLTEQADDVVDRREVQAAYDAHQGNMRDMLFSLYDAHEARRGSVQNNTHA